jgi:short-subunit dehydrogenase
LDFRDKVAIVTGASSGIGRETALALAERGATVVAVARREPLLRSLVEECRRDAPESEYLAGDLGRQDFAERCVRETAERFGRLDLLVNNAGMSLHKQIYHTSTEDVARVMNVNFMSCVWCTFAAIPIMLRDGGGVIVNVSSFASVVAPPREAVYAASKAAMDAFTAGLWNDLHGSGIHVGLVTPGAIDTEIWEKEAEPVAFDGKKWPARVVVDGILRVIEKRRREVTVPGHDPGLVAARWLRRLAPSLLLAGMRRMDPVAPEVLAAARERSRRGRRLGDVAPDADGGEGGEGGR